MFSLFDVDTAANNTAILESINQLNGYITDAEKRQDINSLYLSVKGYLGYNVFNSQEVESDILGEYNSRQGTSLSYEEYGRILERFSEVQKVYNKIKKSVETSMKKLDAVVKRFTSRQMLSVKDQDNVLPHIGNANFNIEKFIRRRQDWAKLLMGIDVLIVD